MGITEKNMETTIMGYIGFVPIKGASASCIPTIRRDMNSHHLPNL